MSTLQAQHPRLETVARPKQARAERTLHRLLDAAEGLIEERGLGDVSIPEIVRRARSSVGGFYARFRDKNELLRALEERFFQRAAPAPRTADARRDLGRRRRARRSCAAACASWWRCSASAAP